MVTRVMIVGNHAQAGRFGMAVDIGDSEKLPDSFFVRTDFPREMGVPVSRHEAVVLNRSEEPMVEVMNGPYAGMKGKVMEAAEGGRLRLSFGDVHPFEQEIAAKDIIALEEMAVSG